MRSVLIIKKHVARRVEWCSIWGLVIAQSLGTWVSIAWAGGNRQEVVKYRLKVNLVLKESVMSDLDKILEKIKNTGKIGFAALLAWASGEGIDHADVLVTNLIGTESDGKTIKIDYTDSTYVFA